MLASAGVCEAEGRKGAQEWMEGASARAGGPHPSASASASAPSDTPPSNRPPSSGRVPVITPPRPLGEAVAALDAEVAAARAAVAKLEEGGGK